MGRGDKKTAKGKRFKGSFGKSRPVTKSAAKKAAAKKTKQAEKEQTQSKKYSFSNWYFLLYTSRS